ncbi:MAG TPA: acyl-CoA dehydrogenase family protein [Aliidongia sp.]|nr:acyl-CoA dehydrogenase family protein [Aliidongia sp.]
MNFDFSDDLKLLRDQTRKFLREHSPTKSARRILDGEAPYDAALWRRVAELGWLGAAIPEEYGGIGLGYEGLCVLAEELGMAVSPIPFSSSIYLAAEAILAAGSEAQKQAYLPKLAAGERIACFALAEGPGNPNPTRIMATVEGGKLSGVKLPVADGGIADMAVVAARSEGKVGLFLVELATPGVTRETLKTIDPSRDHAKLGFDQVPAEPLGPADGWPIVRRVLDRAAILFAFEQVGGAGACLDMARNYALERHAFGRPIGSFQAIKHKLADVYIATELARSNAYYGAWALASDAAELPLAAAAARVSAIEAFHLAAKENIQTHGGMGFTWAFDCHLYYRRAKQLALAIGSAPYWKDRLVDELERRNER